MTRNPGPGQPVDDERDSLARRLVAALDVDDPVSAARFVLSRMDIQQARQVAVDAERLA